MSAPVRVVLADVTFTYDGFPHLVRAGSIVSVYPGSALESMYGSDNLSPVIPASDPRRSPEGAASTDKSWLSN